MLFANDYRTITKPAFGEFKDKGSVFLSFIHPISSESEFKGILESIKKAHPKANHHCYAFALGPAHQAHRFSDDQEPSGTAGRPMMSVIKSNDLTDVMIVVVRYFGGTLLGVPGLIHAYRKASEAAVSNATVITKRIREKYELEFPYVRIGEMEHLFRKYEIDVLERKQNDYCVFLLDIPKEHSPVFIDIIRNGYPFMTDCKISLIDR